MQCAANAVTTRDCGLLGRGSIPLGVTKKALETGLFFVSGNQEVSKKVIRHMFDYLIHKKEEDLHI